MQGLDEQELARLAGVPSDLVTRMVEHGLLPTEGEPALRTEDVLRVQYVEAFERSGISMESLRRAVETGHISLAFTEVQWQNPWVGEFSGETWAQAAERVAFPFDMLERMFEVSGFPRPGADDPISATDARVMPTLAALFRMMPDPNAAAHVIRIYADNLRRMAQAEAHFYHAYVEEPMLRSRMSEREMRDQAIQVSQVTAPLVDALVMWIYHRHQMHFVLEDLVEHLEGALEEAGVGGVRSSKPHAMVFLDLAGYTRLTEERGDTVAADLAGALGDFVSTHSVRFAGTPVKWLGDGVMFHFPDPADAVACALDMVEGAPEAGLPAAHVGAEAGPVIVRDGDYFGRTVNVAARIAGEAGPGEVLVGQGLVGLARAAAIRFEPMGPVSLKGLLRPITVYRARRA